jgi:hypothetical protein
MVPETHELEFQTSEELSMFVRSREFLLETAQKLRDQYEVDVALGEPKSGMHGDQEIVVEKLMLSYTRNNAGGLKDAIDFLLLPFISRGLEATEIKGAIPRPKSDSFEDNMPFFESKLLQRAEAPLTTESPTRASFAEDGQQRSFFDKLRKPGSMSSFSSFLDRRRNGSNSPGSLFKHASSNASKASLVSMESRDSGYRNPWNDSGIDLEHDAAVPGAPGLTAPSTGHAHSASHGMPATTWGSLGAPTSNGIASSSRPNTSSNSLSGAFETKFPFGTNGNASTSSLSTPLIPGLGMVNGHGQHTTSVSSLSGDITPRYDGARNGSLSRPASRAAHTATNVSDANASSGYPAPIGSQR